MKETKGLSKIEVVTTLSNLSNLTNELCKKGITGVTVSQVLGCGVQNGAFEYEEKNDTFSLLPKQLVWMVVEDSILDDTIECIKKILYTGHIGDGKIFVTPVTNVVRVRTGDEGFDALR